MTTPITPENQPSKSEAILNRAQADRVELARLAVEEALLNVSHIKELNIEGAAVVQPETVKDVTAKLRLQMDNIKSLRQGHLTHPIEQYRLMERVFSVFLPGQEFTEDDLLERERLASRQLWQREDLDNSVFLGDDHRWYYSEHTLDPLTKSEVSSHTIVYDVTPDGVIKKMTGQPNTIVEGEELATLHTVARLYHETILKEVYLPKSKLIK